MEYTVCSSILWHQEMIANEKFMGDTFVMFALLRDIANGLVALQQSFVKVHGMLSSENCLVNDSWEVRISDFGLNMLRQRQQIAKKSWFDVFNVVKKNAEFLYETQ